MKIEKYSQNCINLIKKYEGCYLAAYRDSGNLLTIGFGHTKNVYSNQIITKKEAIDFLKEDLHFVERKLNSLNLQLNQNQYDAICSFIFNVGFENFERSSLLKIIRIDPFNTQIRNEFKKWIFCKNKRLNGLYNRRMAESQLYFTKEEI